MLKNLLLIYFIVVSSIYANDPEKIKNKDKTSFDLRSCTACHGDKFQKIALGKSTIVKGQSAVDIEISLMAYKVNKRNKDGFGLLMNSRVKNISNADIKAIATYIANIK